MTSTIEVGHICPNCKKGLILTLEGDWVHLRGSVRLAEEASAKVIKIQAETQTSPSS